MQLTGYDHVNLAMPADYAEEARAFYGGIFRLKELKRPDTLTRPGTLWFGSDNVTVHLGIDDDFRPARRAHPAFRVEGLEELRQACEAAGHETIIDDAIPGWNRFFVYDPFGNRIECMEPES